MKRYPFRVLDSNIVVWVNYEEMIGGMDAQGFLTLKDGRNARRARDLEAKPERAPKQIERAEHVSDSLGFIAKQLPERLEHLEKSGCRGIEFREDPDVPGFMQVVCDSQKAKLAYAAKMGMHDHNSRNGGQATLTEKDLQDAKELVSRGR